MHIQIKPLGGRVIDLEVDELDTIHEIKTKIALRQGILLPHYPIYCNR